MSDAGYKAIKAQQNTACELLMQVCADGATGAALGIRGNLCKQADITSISVKAFVKTTSAQGVVTWPQRGSAITPSVASSIFDAAQTTGVLSALPSGGNCKVIAPATWFTTTDDVQIEATFTLADSSVVRGDVFLVTVLPIYS